MEFLEHSYYVGLLSAAAIHGASHQAPMVFQVVTPAKLRERKVGRGRIQFIQRADISNRPRVQHNVPTGRIWISTPEVTVFDLVESPEQSAGLSNAATIIGGFLIDGMLNPVEMASVGAQYPKAVVQKAGYLVDFMADELGLEFDTEFLHELATGSRYRVLVPGSGPGPHDPRWHIVANAEIEHDQ